VIYVRAMYILYIGVLILGDGCGVARWGSAGGKNVSPSKTPCLLRLMLTLLAPSRCLYRLVVNSPGERYGISGGEIMRGQHGTCPCRCLRSNHQAHIEFEVKLGRIPLREPQANHSFFIVQSTIWFCSQQIGDGRNFSVSRARQQVDTTRRPSQHMDQHLADRNAASSGSPSPRGTRCHIGGSWTDMRHSVLLGLPPFTHGLVNCG